MTRVTINLEEETGEKLKERAKKERRSISSHVVTLVEADLRSAGMIADNPDVIRLVDAANEVGLPKAIAAVRRAARKR